MQLITTLVALHMVQNCESVLIEPSSTDPDPNIMVDLTNDPRGINKETDNNWKIYQDYDNPLYQWALEMRLSAEKYSFQSGKESKLTITMDGKCKPEEDGGQCDAYYSFNVGDEYITFAHDFDGRFWIDGKRGIFIYPSCNSNQFADGDASQIYPSDTSSEFTIELVRDALAGGDLTNWDRITSSGNGDTWPVTFEFINNEIDGTFTFKFISSTLPEGEVQCLYDTTFPTEKDFKFYMSPDRGLETIKIKSFDISGENIGTECEMCGCSESVKFVPDNDYWNEIDYDEPLNVRTIIWSGAISIILSFVTVCISHLICVKAKSKTQVYDKVHMDTDYSSS